MKPIRLASNITFPYASSLLPVRFQSASSPFPFGFQSISSTFTVHLQSTSSLVTEIVFVLTFYDFIHVFQIEEYDLWTAPLAVAG